MTCMSGLLRNFLGVSASVALLLGCGGKSENDSVLQGATAGGSTGAAITTAQGGSLGLGGASSMIAVGGTRVAITSTPTETGGTTSYPPTTGGANAGTGGNKPITGGAASTGGKLSTGGTVSTGGASSNAGGSPAGGSAGSGGTGGDPLTDFCTGSESKVSYQGQEVLAPVTSYQSGLVFDCCMAYGVNWHAKASLGFDLEVEVISTLGSASGTGPGVYSVDDSYGPLRAAVHRPTDSPTGVATRGTAQLITAFSFNDPWELGLCLEVSDPTSDLFGTRLYVPQVTIISYASFSRFQMFLLNDSTLYAEQAAAVPLDSLVLAPNPFLDLGKIAFMVQATGEVGLNPGQKYGDSVLALLNNRLDHLPFVVLADGVRIYLGTLVSESQRMPYGPVIMPYDITTDGFYIRAPMQGTDPRNDSRIIAALTETGKLIP